jgi:hypothetical protein
MLSIDLLTGQAMVRMSLTAILIMLFGAQVQAQTCDTLGGGVNCDAGRAPAVNSTPPDSKTPRAPGGTIGPNPDDLKVIGTDTSVDPLGRPKATLGGTTFYSDGRQCTRIGLTVTCK